ncbi:MAG: FAD-binding protein [Coriobacteriales bacterium]|nr:FAD-binding protein [Coriobacteriales bacterium]
MSVSLSRRAFVGAAAATAASVGVVSSALASEQEAPAVEAADEEIICDFVVAGAGMCGYCAAIKAAELGCTNIVLLEKNSFIGGSSLYAEGIFGNGDDFQKEQGFEPADPEKIFEEELQWSHGVIRADLFKNYIYESGEYINWLIEKGVIFTGIGDAGTGNHCMHGYLGGNATSAIEILSAYAKENYGIEALLETPAVDLLMDGNTCVGARARTPEGKLIDYKAPTVCLATGGIGSNDDMMEEYTKLELGKWRHLGAAGQDGDAITMVEKTIHGRAKNVCAANMWLTIDGAPVMSVVNNVAGQEGSNIWINQKGVRFMNESLAQQFFVCNNLVHGQGRAYSLFDQDHVEFFKNTGTTCFWSGFCYGFQPIATVQEDLDEAAADDSIALAKFDTLDEVAEYMGVDAATLKETVDNWNAQVEAGVDSEFGKAGAPLCKVATAPFYTAKLKTGVLNSVGGVRVDTDGCVMAPDGTHIEGLYAGGNAASGFTGEVYGMAAPGSNQGPAVYLGLLAGKAAAARK